MEEATLATELPLAAGPEAPESPLALSAPMPLTCAQVPVYVLESVFLVVISAAGPGSGNTTSVPETVVQPLARLARKMDGRLANATAGVARLDAAVTATDEQDM